MRRYLERHWYRDEPPPRWLQPLSRLYASVAERRAQRQRAVAQRLPVPVVVVGNVAVGGTGKTPCVLWIVAALQAMGRHPGILSRGYGGRGPFPLTVDAQTAPAICGDEPALLARRARVPLACAPDRVAAGRHLLAAHPEVDVLVCDDGLQHYRLARDLEFCVVDAARGFGNGWQLPAGPLREPRARAEACALLLVNGSAAAAYGLKSACFDLVADGVRRVGGAEQRSFADFAAREVCAVAGIGRPQRFFNMLRQRGLTVHGRAFADHHAYRAADFAFAAGAPVLMTEKDAVKCEALPVRELWYVPVTACFSPTAEQQVVDCLAQLPRPAVGARPLP